jgi:DNA-binding XRE family transcriptional regulator
MDDERREPIRLIGETADTVTLQRADYEALLSELEDAEDRAAALGHRLAKREGTAQEMLTLEEAERLIEGENLMRFWREKRGLTQRALAGMAGVSTSLLAEIEAGTKTGSVDTLRKLAQVLKVDLDALVP